MNEKYFEARRLIKETVEQFKQSADANEMKYWQGRKDGSRLMFGIMNDDDSQQGLVESSPGYRPTDQELMNDLLGDAVYNVAAILYELDELHKAHPQTKRNLYEFVRRYDYLSQRGKVPVIDDHCLLRD